MYLEVCNKDGRQSEYQRLLLGKGKPDISREFNILLCMGRFKSLGLLKSFLLHASPAIWGQQIHFFFSHPHPELLSNLIMEGGGTGWISGIVILWGAFLTFAGLKSLMAVILFIDVTGDVPFTPH